MHSVSSAPAARMHSHHEHALKSPPAQKPGKPEDSPRPSASAEAESREAPDKTRAKGVLRLIEEDHFRGRMPDIRLRMNFHAELQEKDAEAQAESARTAATQLRADISEALAKTANELDEPLVEPVGKMFNEFDRVISDSLDNEAAAGPDINATVVDALEALIQGLTGGLDEGDPPGPSVPSAIGETEAVSTAALGDTEETENMPSDPVAPQPIVQRLLGDIDRLAVTFEETANSVTQLSSIEGIIAPAGNGVAFEKFVEQYRAQFESSVDQNDPSPIIDDHA